MRLRIPAGSSPAPLLSGTTLLTNLSRAREFSLAAAAGGYKPDDMAIASLLTTISFRTAIVRADLRATFLFTAHGACASGTSRYKATPARISDLLFCHFGRGNFA